MRDGRDVKLSSNDDRTDPFHAHNEARQSGRQKKLVYD